MIIDRKLNLVIPIVRDDKTVLYVHATPLHPETFDQYYLVLAKAFSAFTNNGLDPRSGPSVAAMVLRDVAKSTLRTTGANGEAPTTWWEGNDGVGGPAGLMAGMTRLCNVLIPTDAGWETKPLAEAEAKKLLSDEEKAEVANILTYFTVVSLVAPKTIRGMWVEGLAALYGLQTTFLGVMDFVTSLQTSTTDESTGEKTPA